MLLAEPPSNSLPGYLVALPREARETIADHLQVSLLCVEWVSRDHTGGSVNPLTLDRVQTLLAAAAAHLELARTRLCSASAALES